jgi:hypothetical protein
MRLTHPLYRKCAGNTINETQEIFVESGEIPFNVYEEAGEWICLPESAWETLAFSKATGYTMKQENSAKKAEV